MADIFDDDFVDVYSKTTGQIQTIPREWLDHEVLGADFSLTPTAAARRAAERSEEPSDLWTIDELRDYADAKDIDLTGVGRKKADVLTRVLAPQITTTTTPSNETPASGEEE